MSHSIETTMEEMCADWKRTIEDENVFSDKMALLARIRDMEDAVLRYVGDSRGKAITHLRETIGDAKRYIEYVEFAEAILHALDISYIRFTYGKKSAICDIILLCRRLGYIPKSVWKFAPYTQRMKSNMAAVRDECAALMGRMAERVMERGYASMDEAESLTRMELEAERARLSAVEELEESLMSAGERAKCIPAPVIPKDMLIHY